MMTAGVSGRQQKACDKCEGGMRALRMAATGGWPWASTSGDIVDKRVEMPSPGTPFSARGEAWRRERLEEEGE